MAQADLKRVEQLATEARVAREKLRQAIVVARDSGETLEDIGEAAGLTRQRISQILQEHAPE